MNSDDDQASIIADLSILSVRDMHSLPMSVACIIIIIIIITFDVQILLIILYSTVVILSL